MEQTRTLYMTFKTSMEKKCSITVDDPRENITEQEIVDCMNLILSKNIFLPGGYPLVEAYSAKIVNQDTTEFDLEI